MRPAAPESVLVVAKAQGGSPNTRSPNNRALYRIVPRHRAVEARSLRKFEMRQGGSSASVRLHCLGLRVRIVSAPEHHLHK